MSVLTITLAEKEGKKSRTRGHVKDIGSTVGIQLYRGQGYEGAMSGDCFTNFWHLHLYVMAVLSGARVVRVRWVLRRPPADGQPRDAVGIGPIVIGVYVRRVERLLSASCF